MDAKVFRLAILTILSAFVLVLVIIYATNMEKINGLFGWGEKKQIAVTEETEEATDEEVVIYGDQIGDNLDAFILDEEFFDETEEIPSVVVIKRTNSNALDTSENSEGAKGGSDEAAETDSGEEGGSGMAVVGELQNPNMLPSAGMADDGATIDSSGYLTSLPQMPEGGYGTYIPSDQTVTGTAVGN